MSITLLRTPGGTLLLPDLASVLLDRADGGNLVVLPPRPVWERSELDQEELVQWGFLVASSGRAMLDVLPQLDGGCINYWEFTSICSAAARHRPTHPGSGGNHRCFPALPIDSPGQRRSSA